MLNIFFIFALFYGVISVSTPASKQCKCSTIILIARIASKRRHRRLDPNACAAPPAYSLTTFSSFKKNSLCQRLVASCKEWTDRCVGLLCPQLWDFIDKDNIIIYITKVNIFKKLINRHVLLTSTGTDVNVIIKSMNDLMKKLVFGLLGYCILKTAYRLAANWTSVYQYVSCFPYNLFLVIRFTQNKHFPGNEIKNIF